MHSSLAPFLKLKQPEWANQAERAVAIQMRCQGIPPALLSAVVIEHQPFLLREMQPLADRLDLYRWNSKVSRLENVIHTMGQIVAWGQLRSGGRQGSAIADDLIAFGEKTEWREHVLAYAEKYAAQVEEDFKDFSAAYDAGKLKG